MNFREPLRLTALLLLLGAAGIHGGEYRHTQFNFDQAEAVADQQLGRKVDPKAAQGNQGVQGAQVEKIKLDPNAPKLCPNCKGTFQIPCPNFPTKVPHVLIQGQENKVCPLCQSVGFVICPVCKQKPENKDACADAETRWKAVQKTMQDGLAYAKSLEAPDKLGYKVSGYATPHLGLVSTMPERVALSCASHGESLIAKLNVEFKGEHFFFTSPSDLHGYLIDTPPQYKTLLEKLIAPRYKDYDMALALKTAGDWASNPPSFIAAFYDHLGKSQPAAEHLFVHSLAHVLLNRVEATRHYPAWVQEGFAAYGETLELGQPETYCCAYDSVKVDLAANRNRVLTDMIKKNQVIKLDLLTKMDLTDMKSKEYYQAWSMITMLIERDADKFRAFLKALPEGSMEQGGLVIKSEDQEAALKEAYGYDFPKFLAVWQQYVLYGK